LTGLRARRQITEATQGWIKQPERSKAYVAKRGTGMDTESGVSAPIRIALPSRAVYSPAKADDAGATGKSGAQPLKVLIADDHIDIANSLSMLLQLWGHRTWIAGDGLQAFAAAEVFKPDVFLLDLKMPGLDGFQVCQRVRATAWGRRTLIAAISGAEDDSLLHKHEQKADFDARLKKPIDLDALKKLITGLRN
jgi:CheY-like chemotaxis protein